MTVINLFFIPAISVYILYKLKNRDLQFNAELLLTYMVNCSVVSVITKLVMFIVKYLFSFEHTQTHTAYFAVAALAVSVILPFLVNSLKVTVNKK